MSMGRCKMWHEHRYKLHGVIPLDVIYTVVDVGDGSREIDELIIEYDGKEIALPQKVVDEITGDISI